MNRSISYPINIMDYSKKYLILVVLSARIQFSRKVGRDVGGILGSYGKPIVHRYPPHLAKLTPRYKAQGRWYAAPLNNITSSVTSRDKMFPQIIRTFLADFLPFSTPLSTHSNPPPLILCTPPHQS